MFTAKPIFLFVFMVMFQGLLSSAKFLEDEVDNILMNDDRNSQDEGDCVDTSNKCGEWKTYLYCTKPGFKDRMMKECKKTCGFCSKYCRDTEKDKCPKWKESGYCESGVPSLREVMKKYCTKTCGYCHKAAASKCALSEGTLYGCCWDGTVKKDYIGTNCRPCVDSPRFASRICYKFRSACDNGGMTESWLTRFCPKTCALCGHEGEECIDREQRLCPEWEERGYCDHRNVDVKNRMIKYCAKTCGICTPIEVVKRK